ncbi:chitinase [uncultured Jatrophihabitans sp.]|uniref:chitinase n=1 Tax=uncultured Jatrophihabitans sp. TaxID=1610747 RepID=UPI0035CB8A1C
MTPEEVAYASADTAASAAPTPVRRLSPARVGALVAGLAVVAAALVAFRTAGPTTRPAALHSSFLPYVDATVTPLYAFENMPAGASTDLVLGFVVGAKDNGCAPTWGAAYTPAQAADSLDLDRRIARLRQRGGDAVVSFGGQANDELATRCADPTALLAGYRSIVERYSLDTIDLDIEGGAASAAAVDQRRARAIAALQRARRKAGHPLQVWLTLPVDPSGLTGAGWQIVGDMLAAKVTLAGVNGLTMDYGASRPKSMSMLAATESALDALNEQVRSAYQAAGRSLTTAQAWQHIGATPMIGQNDGPADRFSLADTRALLAFARSRHMGRLSMWSANRDQSCGPNYADVTVASNLCSGVDQSPNEFAKILHAFGTSAVAADAPAGSSGSADSSGVAGSAGSAANSTAPDLGSSTANSIVDDPATSPYPIWNPVVPYQGGTKIVWHRSVYEAKWWTRGDTPDAPVASAADSPWTLIGPVLPGEHPAPTPTLSAGVYPAWSAAVTYRAGARVLYRGVGYQAKWYTRGDVPGEQVSDPGQTPWEFITGPAATSS